MFFPPLEGLAVIGHFEVARESGLMLCRIAPVSKIQSKLRRKNYLSPQNKLKTQSLGPFDTTPTASSMKDLLWSKQNQNGLAYLGRLLGR